MFSGSYNYLASVTRGSFPYDLFTPEETARSSNYPVLLSANVTRKENGSIPRFLGSLHPDWSCIRCRYRAKTRSKVPWYVAQRRASLWLALVTVPPGP